jgi:hypothetical protein
MEQMEQMRYLDMNLKEQTSYEYQYKNGSYFHNPPI